MSESEYGPFAEIIWVETYHVAVDCLVAAPVRKHGAVQWAIKTGQARVLTEEEAKSRNAATAAFCHASKRYIDEFVAERWRRIGAQRNLT